MVDKMTRLEFIAEADRRRRCGLLLRGKTYDKREEIKAAGGIWDKESQAWLLPTAHAILALGGVPVENYFELQEAAAHENT